MTEEEAKTKWCPHLSVENCVASKCMAWRKTYKMVVDQNPNGTSIAEMGSVTMISCGYCGLAGKP